MTSTSLLSSANADFMPEPWAEAFDNGLGSWQDIRGKWSVDGGEALSAGTFVKQSVERSVALLRAFVDERPEMWVGEIVKVTGIGRSTESRQFATLESLGLVQRDEASAVLRDRAGTGLRAWHAAEERS